ncbi:transporter [Chitinophaga sp. Cy-1792]|uniref:SphA family protein n=1 Tax=Chitinophaga sp. Cy-1792 TaxID=2608339 RepID=UPI00141EA14A|nr:transporter [Chitinophaga sp. Cy-1792]NIG54928.1 transporter [Chitinophaga sp. Cy-1792]
MKKYLIIFVCASALLLLQSKANAQLKGDHILGDLGLQSGSQTPPGFSVFIPVYLYNTNKLKNAHGDVVQRDIHLNMFVTGIGGAWVTNLKILGANYGGSVLIPFASNRLEATSTSKSPFAFSDIYFQPVQLGWHIKQADFVFSYSLYFPSGRYELGGDKNSGLGQLVNEFAAGSTVFFDKKKEWNFSALFSYALNGKKKDTDLRTGNNLSIEGGFGKTWYLKAAKGPIPKIVNFGPVYYMQFKTTEDKIPVGTFILDPKKDHIYAVGAEGSVFLPGIRTQFNLRWLGEAGAVNRFQGNTFFLMMAYNIKSFAKAKQ